MKRLLLIFLLLSPVLSFAQGTGGPSDRIQRSAARVIVNSDGSVTVTLATGKTLTLTPQSSLPGTCSVGQMFFKSGTGAGLYNCVATNTWSQVARILSGTLGAIPATCTNPDVYYATDQSPYQIYDCNLTNQWSQRLLASTTVGAAQIATSVLDGSVAYCADAGSTDTYACTLSPAPSGYVTGARYRFKANTANTGAASINFNSLGAKTIKKAAGGITTDLADNDIRSGQFVDLVYDGTNMEMQSTLGNAGGGGAALGANTFTATQTINPANNTSALIVSGSSNTVSDGHNVIDIAQTWNTSSTPAVISANITDTSSNSQSSLLLFEVNGQFPFYVRKNGDINTSGNIISSSNIHVGSTAELLFENRSVMISSADGNITFLNNAASAKADVVGKTFQVVPTTVSGLPTCNSGSKGTMAAVTDASSPTFLGTVTGGSSTYTPVSCNGTNWVAY